MWKGIAADSISFEDDSSYEWHAFGADEEPLHRLVCLAGHR